MSDKRVSSLIVESRGRDEVELGVDSIHVGNYPPQEKESQFHVLTVILSLYSSLSTVRLKCFTWCLLQSVTQPFHVMHQHSSKCSPLLLIENVQQDHWAPKNIAERGSNNLECQCTMAWQGNG